MSDMARQLIENEARLVKAWGESLPEFSDKVRLVADQAVELDVGSPKWAAPPSNAARAAPVTPHRMLECLASTCRATDDPAYAWQAIELSVNNDDDAEVERRLEELLARHGIFAPAADLMAQRLRERDPERALVLARRAVRFRGGPDALETLGRIQLESGNAANAAKTLSRSVKARPDSPSTQYWLGAALSAAGDEDGARQALGVALETDGFPEREAAVAELARLNAE